jgi:hypothetical protein
LTEGSPQRFLQQKQSKMRCNRLHDSSMQAAGRTLAQT